MSITGEVQKLQAVEEIKRLKAAYFRALDDQDWPAFRQLFCSDALCEVRGEHFVTADEFVSAVRRTFRGAASVHHGHMPEIEITGPSTATGIWMLFDRLEFPPDSDRTSFYGYARYYEEYRREGELWRIAKLRFERLGEADTSCDPPMLLGRSRA